MTPVPFDWSSVSRRPGGGIWRLVKPCGLTLVWSLYARRGIRVPVSLGDENPIFQLKHLGLSWSWQQQTGGVKGFELHFHAKEERGVRRGWLRRG
jgi:hypothetical protein